MKLIVGLGNPGRKYNKTRHNIGFHILDEYISNKKWTKKFNSLCFEKLIDNNKVIFLKPQTFMNLSGNAVKLVVDYYKINLDNILVIHDDLDLEFGKIKLKYDSNSGGHNGVESIIKNLGSKKFNRLKIGINTQYNIDAANFVLSNFTREEFKTINNELTNYFEIINEFIRG